MPTCQFGRPLDFLADAEEPRAARGGCRRRCPASVTDNRQGSAATAVVLPIPGPDPATHPRTAEGCVYVATVTCNGEGGRAMMGLGGVENRCYTRFTLRAPVTIWRANMPVAGEVVNISLGGALLRLEPSLWMHEAVMVSVPEKARPPGLLNDLPATVVRTTRDGCAVRFDRMLLDRGIGESLNGPFFG
jgi:hypothetical protein